MSDMNHSNTNLLKLYPDDVGAKPVVVYLVLSLKRTR